MCLPKALEEAQSWEVEDASLSPPGVERRPLMGKKTCSAGLTLRRAQRTGIIRRGGGGAGGEARALMRSRRRGSGRAGLRPRCQPRRRAHRCR